MPIMRTFQCPECNHRIEVTLSADQWDAPPPSCEACDAREMRQQFYPPAIGGSINGQAHAIAEDILANDYHVADVNRDTRQGSTPKVRYRDQTADVLPSTWGSMSTALQTAISVGRQTRLQHGNGLDILQANLKSGAQPDLIAASKKRAIRIY